jgi:hypothetical protein
MGRRVRFARAESGVEAAVDSASTRLDDNGALRLGSVIGEGSGRLQRWRGSAVGAGIESICRSMLARYNAL